MRISSAENHNVAQRGEVGPDTGMQTRLTRNAAFAHVVYSPELRQIQATEPDPEAYLLGWLSMSLGVSFRPPKLQLLGYQLIDGRLLPGDHGPAAHFLYFDGNSLRLTLYVSTDQALYPAIKLGFAQEGPVGVYYWIDGKVGYALAGSIDKPELGRLAHAVHAQLSRT